MLMTLNELTKKLAEKGEFCEITVPVDNEDTKDMNYWHIFSQPLGNNKEDIYALTYTEHIFDYYEKIGTITFTENGYSVEFCKTTFKKTPASQIITARFSQNKNIRYFL